MGKMKKYFYSEKSYNDFLFKSRGTGHGQDGKSGLYEVEYEPKWKKNDKINKKKR